MKLRITASIFYLLTTISLWSQTLPEPLPSYDTLQSQIELHEGTPKVWPYLKKYLLKAKQETNWQEAASAYKEMLHESEGNVRFLYADSMVYAASRSNDQDLVGAAYLTKGVAHYQYKEHEKALDNYLLANKYLVGSKDDYLRHKVKYSIAQLKYYLGYYNEAIAMFRECIDFFRAHDAVPYLKSLHALSLCYINTEHYALSAATTDLALKESARLKEKSMLHYFDMATGVRHYKAGSYKQSIGLLEYALPLIKRDGDFATEAATNLYLGKAFWDSGDTERAITHFLEVERLIKVNRFIRPELRRAYEFLIKYYHGKNQKDIELNYIDKLLQADTMLGKEFRFLSTRIYKEYDTAELLAEKEKIQYDLKRSQWSGWLVTGLAGMLAIVIVLLIVRHNRLQAVYRKRFEELLYPSPAQKAPPQPLQDEILSINPVIVNDILLKLAEFERKKAFLRKDLNANKLAESFGTNYKYLSKVIRSHKQKSFVNYINELRIDYLVNRLKEESLLRRYTNGALANEAGFSTAQHFTTAFKKATGISPAYFIEKLGEITIV